MLVFKQEIKKSEKYEKDFTKYKTVINVEETFDDDDDGGDNNNNNNNNS